MVQNSPSFLNIAEPDDAAAEVGLSPSAHLVGGQPFDEARANSTRSMVFDRLPSRDRRQPRAHAPNIAVYRPPPKPDDTSDGLPAPIRTAGRQCRSRHARPQLLLPRLGRRLPDHANLLLRPLSDDIAPLARPPRRAGAFRRRAVPAAGERAFHESPPVLEPRS